MVVLRKISLCINSCSSYRTLFGLDSTGGPLLASTTRKRKEDRMTNGPCPNWTFLSGWDLDLREIHNSTDTKVIIAQKGGGNDHAFMNEVGNLLMSIVR